MTETVSVQTEDSVEGMAHEIWATAQLMPGEGIEDGVKRILSILRSVEAHPAIQRYGGIRYAKVFEKNSDRKR